MNYLSVPRKGLPQNESQGEGNEPFFRKDSFLQNSQHQLSSYKYLPQIGSNQPHSSTFIPFPEQRNNMRKELEELKQTVAQFKKSLQELKYGQERNITQKTEISYVIRSLFNTLKQIIKSNRNSQDFQWVFQQYIYVLRRKQNYQHFFTQVSGHLKQILGSSELAKLRKNRKIFIFLSRLFPYCPHTVHKILMNKAQIFDNETSEEAIKVYKEFVKFTAQKSNSVMLLGWIKNELSKQSASVQKLTVLLGNFKERLNLEMIELIETKIDQLIQNFLKYNKENAGIEKQLINLIDQFLQMDWPTEGKKYKIIIKYINNWNKDMNLDTQKTINKFLKNMPSLNQNKIIIQQIHDVLYGYIMNRLLIVNAKVQKSTQSRKAYNKDFNETFIFLTIIFDRSGRAITQSIIQKSYFKKTIVNLISEDFPLKDGLINMLSTLKKLNVHEQANKIQTLLIDKMITILSDEKGTSARRYSQIYQKEIKKMEQTAQTKTENDLLYCIKALRYFSFNYESFWNIYSMIKRYIFKKKIINLYGYEFKKQVVKSCLYIIEKLEKPQQCKNILTDALYIIGQQDVLKTLYIKWVNQNNQFYEKKIFQVYNTPQGLEDLIHDYSSKNIEIKSFSIKMLCLLYPYNQCEIIPFLKKTYYQIYQRLSVNDLVDLTQKKIGLKLIREIIKQRSEIVKDDSTQFASFLYNELCQIIKHNYHHHIHTAQRNQLIVEILKTIISLVKIMKECILPYVRTLGFHLISLINSKITTSQIKKYCLETFKEMTFYCGYVILPYFYHKNLLLIFREIIKTDDRNHIYRNSLMKLIGSLGYVSKQKFFRLKKLTDNVQQGGQSTPQCYALVEFHFEKTFKEINYLKQMKLIQKPPKQLKDSRDLRQVKQFKQSKDSKQSRQLIQIKQLKESKLSLTQWKQQKQFRQNRELHQIKQIKPFPATAPYYTEEKVNYKISNENFNYKKMIIQKVLQNMNQQSSSIIFYNTFKTLQSFIFVLPKSDEKMYQDLIFSKILFLNKNFTTKDKQLPCMLTAQKQKSIIQPQTYPLNNVLPLLVKIIFYQDFKQYINELFDFFFTHLNNEDKRTMIFQCLYVIASRDSEIIKFEIKQFILRIRKNILDLSKTFQLNKDQELLNSNVNLQQIKHQILVCFGILTNLSKYLDNYLHLFLPDFNKIFIRRPQQICQTYFSLLMKLFQNCPSTQQFLSEISDRMFDLLVLQLDDLRNTKPQNTPQLTLLKRLNGSHKTASISFINNIIDFLISILLIFGDKFKGFSDRFHKTIRQYNYKSHMFYSVVQDFMKKSSSFYSLHYFFQKSQLNQIMKFQGIHISLKTQQEAIIKNVYKHESVLNFAILNEMIENFNCDQNQVEQQSEEWFAMLSISIFEKSEDPFIRACLPIVKQDKMLCNDLFPMAFYFFWNVLNNEFRRRLTMKLKNILENKGVSLKVKQKFIDTIYFMEQQQFPIPIADKILRDASQEVLDLAKSLFYMQKLFLDDPQAHGQSLIKMYTEMGQTESAVGLLSIVQNLTTKTKIQLYQKLNRYREAMRQHDNLKDKTKLQNIELDIKIKKDMFQWEAVLNKCQKLEKYKKGLSHYAVQSAVNLGKWDSAKKYLSNVEQNHEKYNLWKAILSLNEKKYDDVEKYIKKDRQLIYPKICQLFNFSFERKMEGVIRLQTLTELQQANDYLKIQKNLGSSEEEKKKNYFMTLKKKTLIDSVWNDRIEGANTNLWSMQQLMLSRSLLFSKTDDIDNWISYSRLALKQNQAQLAKKTLGKLQDELKDPKYTPLLKEQKDRRKNQFIIETLLVQCKFILGDLRDQEAVTQIEKLIEQKGTSGSHHEYFYKCAMWLAQKQFDFTLQKAKKSVQLLNNAVKDFKTYIKGWHFLGLLHNRILEMLESKKKPQNNTMTNKPSQRRISTFLSSSKDIQQSQLSNLNATKNPKDKDSREHDSRELIKEGKQVKERDSREFHISQALRCFIESVKCGVKNHQYFLQDCLKIMNIIFTEHEVEGVLTDILEEYEHIPPEGLIQIIPQIVGRLDIADKPILLDIMKKLLVHIGIAHPQAIIFPLIFCKKSGNITKKIAAVQIFAQVSRKERSFYQRLQKQSGINQILKDAQKITEQLIKVSLKLNEKFYINVNKIYNSSAVKGVCSRQIAVAYLTFISKMIEDESSLTFSEYGFIQQYRQELKDIKRKLLGYLDLGENDLFKKAEQKIKLLLDQIKSSLGGVNKVYLEEVSPDLYNMKQSKVCLFGQYNPAFDPIYITSFKNELKIVPSKQRPKKIVVQGSNQKDYNFLLKGKQDLRLDERIMQLFSLINKMFYDPSERQNYSIKGYSITPISMEIGIISWVENCDTIGELIIKGRSSGNVYLEKQLSRQICSVYEILPRAQKVEIYKEIEQRVSGTDLKNIFWTRSSSSQEWLKSRTCYVRSLAVMSIVGYIIGLGDRHPNNIMIQRDTGQIVHIDFGDCFDVNKMRKEYPQKVPFRLTRMLVKAMEPCGVHGIFKQTCQKIIKLLRNNKESIITIVEAFRYDPLIGWRLVKNDQGNETEGMLQHSYDDNDISFLTKVGEKMLGEDKPKKEQKKANRNIDFALHILNEIKKKLNGRLFDDSTKVMSPEEQVQKLINEAISPENLVEHYEGWQIYW